MAFSCDSCDVGVFPSAETLTALLPLLAVLLALLPAFPPPPFPPFPPRLPEDAGPGDEAPVTVSFPRLSPLDERLSTCLPSVSGGGGFSGTAPEPLFPLPPPPPLPGVLAPGFTPARADRPMGLEPAGGWGGFGVPVWVLPPSLPPEGPALVLVKAAQPVRAEPGGRDDPPPEEFPDGDT